MNERSRYLDDLKERIKEIRISDIVSRYVNIRRNGANYTGICPFHNDKTDGNLSISPDLNRFRCFACDTSGDAIDFISKYNQLGFVEAALTIGQDYGLILSDDFERFFSDKEFKKFENTKPKFAPKLAEVRTLEKTQSDEILNYAYTAFLNCLTLSENHKNYLKSERKLTKERIAAAKYRSLSAEINEDKVVRQTLKLLRKLNIHSLKGIPGFFLENDKWTFRKSNGLLIPITNEDGLIVGLQIRTDMRINGLRYYWFTSSFASSKNKRQKLGSTPGQPMDILYPKIDKFPEYMFITEGKFKSEIIAKYWGFKVISIQGVTNWKGIEEVLTNIESKQEIKLKKIFVAFDSDMSFKFQVFEQLMKMTDFIKVNLDSEIIYLNWNHEKGKGIDDLILNNKNLKKDRLVRHFDKEEIDKKYIEALSQYKEMYPELKNMEVKEKAIITLFEAS